MCSVDAVQLKKGYYSLCVFNIKYQAEHVNGPTLLLTNPILWFDLGIMLEVGSWVELKSTPHFINISLFPLMVGEA